MQFQAGNELVAEPLARRTIFAGFKQAAIDRWGERGLRAIAAAMSPECRSASIDAVVIDAPMLPERYVLEWYEAAYAGPANRNREDYFAFLDRMMDLGFGRVRKLLLGMASPELVAKKSGELWRHDHTHGSLRLAQSKPREVVLRLTDHPYVETPLARASVAEIYRYAMSLARAPKIGAEHRVVDGGLDVRVWWG